MTIACDKSPGVFRPFGLRDITRLDHYDDVLVVSLMKNVRTFRKCINILVKFFAQQSFVCLFFVFNYSAL